MSDELREQLADVQHAIWAHWMRYQFSQCRRPDLADDGSLIIPADKVQRWQRQMDTPYSDLTDKERDSDRHQADKVLSVVQPELDQLRAALAAATQRAEQAERELAIWRTAADIAGPNIGALFAERDELRAKLVAVPVKALRRYLRYSQVPDHHHRYAAAERQADEATIAAWLAQQSEVQP